MSLHVVLLSMCKCKHKSCQGKPMALYFGCLICPQLIEYLVSYIFLFHFYFFNTNFVEILFTYHTIYPLRLYTSMAFQYISVVFSIFTYSCNHHHNSQGRFHPRRTPVPPAVPLQYLAIPQPQATSKLLLVPTDLPSLEISLNGSNSLWSSMTGFFR